ncbi:MAG: hypothetical protein GY856_25575 [bacterium]|nr:hypothetical protein [bacterium]
MERSTTLVLLCLSLFLVLSPLVLKEPGWPAGLKADGAAYYLMAMSLARDGDLRCEPEDLRRLFDAFPYHPTHNLILASDDGWHTLYFGKPFHYSLAAAPAAALFGASGMVAFNMALLLGMAWLGARYLRRYNPSPVAALFATGFFLLSVGFAYVFWIHPEVFTMAAVTACLYLGLSDRNEGAPEEDGSAEDRPPSRRWAELLASPMVRGFGSGAALSLAVYGKPMLAALGLPVVFAYWRQRRFKALGSWFLGAALGLGLLMGLAVGLTGHPSAYLGFSRGGFKVCSPHEMPVRPGSAPIRVTAAAEPSDEASSDEASSDEAPLRASWSWIFRVPRFHLSEVLENAGYFLWGRHTGLLLYFPFSGLALLLFLLHARRSGVRWVLLGSLAMVALFFLLWIPFNWHGGGGFVGNRYFVNAYPGFLFLVTRINPRWINVLAYALGAILLGPTIFTPMGRSVPWPTLQAHVRNFPFTLFPLELSIKGVPGYHESTLAGVRIRGRKDVFLPRGNKLWLHGATTVELWVRSREPLEKLLFKVSSFAAPNDVVLGLGKTEERLHFEPGEDEGKQTVELEPGGPTRVLSLQGTPVYFYRIEVSSATGEVREWTQHYPPQDCFYFPYAATTPEAFYVGAQLTYLGTPERVAKDLYAVEWGRCRVPDRVTAGETFTVATEVRNRSAESWPADPPTRVNLSYHWEDAAGNEVTRNGLRTSPGKVVEPGALVAMAQTVLAPSTPGRYTLVLDLVFEEVAWFSQHNGGNVLRLPVEVVPADGESEDDVRV